MNNIDPGEDSIDALVILQQQLDSRGTARVVLEPSVMIIIDVAALAGNLLLCLLVFRVPRIRTPTTLLIVCLAITDLLMAAIVMPLTIDALIHSGRRFSDAVCRVQAGLLAVLAQVSIYLMALTAVNRLLCIKHRSLYQKVFTKKNTMIMVALIWTVAALINAIPNAFSLDDFFFCPGYCLCWRRMTIPSAIYAFNAWLYGSFVLSYIVIVVCYLKVFCLVRQHNEVVGPSLNQMQAASGVSNKEEMSVAKSVAAIIFTFTVLWIPSEVMDSMDKLDPLLLPREVFLSASYLWSLSSAINPFIYGIMNTTIRRECRKMWSPRTQTSQVSDSLAQMQRRDGQT